MSGSFCLSGLLVLPYYTLLGWDVTTLLFLGCAGIECRALLNRTLYKARITFMAARITDALNLFC
jgi:hypothetical protein